MSAPAPTTYVGVDIAAATLAVVRRVAGQPAGPAQAFANDPAGWRALLAALAAQGDAPAGTRVALEATGAYWQGLATALAEAGWAVSVASPASVRHYAQAR